MTKKPEIFLKHIMESIGQIESLTENSGFDSFRANRERHNAVVREFEIIGEAMKNIPLAFKKKYPQLPWAEAMGMRNKLIHEYFGVDLNLIWKTAKKDLPQLKTQIKNILDDIA